MNQDTCARNVHRWSGQGSLQGGRWVSRAAGAVLVSLVLASCGSTVQVRSTGALGSDGLGGPLSTDGTLSGTPDGTATVGGTGVPLPQGTGGTTPAGGSTGRTVTPGQSTTAPGGAGVPAPGVASRKDPIKIGVIITPGLDQAAKVFGIDGLSTGDTKAQAEAVVAWIRAHGGLGGHPITLYSYAIDMGAGSPAAAQNKACTAMTQDYKVRYVVTVLARVEVLTACLAKSGVGLLADGSGLGDKAMAKYAHVLGNPGEIAPGRTMSVLVDDLWKRGWLNSTSRVGVLADDGTDGHDTVNGPLSAALRRHGLSIANTQYVNPNNGDGGSSQSGSAVLQFRSAKVDRIIPVLYSPLYFMQTAESQGYHPAYALYSSLGPGALLEGAVPKDQLKNAAGIGWQPNLDIGKGTRPGPVSSRETLCFDIMKKAGQGSTSSTVKGFQAQVCDVLFYLKDLADRLPSVPSDLLTSGRALLRDDFLSASTFRVDVTNRTDGVAGYRALAYRQDCSCFQYVSPVVATS